MSKGPEANFWNSIRLKLPKKCFATRIENKHGGGVPDVHMVWDGLPFWLELKVTKSNAVSISPHQIAWHMAYCARGGASFYLVKRSTSRELLLFGGENGAALADGGCSAVQGQVFKDVGSMFCALRPLLLSKMSFALRPAPLP